LRVLITEEQLKARTDELAEAIGSDYAGTRPVLVCVLKGAVLFVADLVRRLPFDLEIEFMAVSSYGKSTESSGVVRILKDLETDIEGRPHSRGRHRLRAHAPVPHAQSEGPEPGEPGNGDPSQQAEQEDGRTAMPLHRLRDPRRVRGGVRPGSRREVSQSALPGGRR
jgi:hypothetical protein